MTEDIWANDVFNSGKSTDDFYAYNSHDDEQGPWDHDEFGPDADVWNDLSGQKDADQWIDMFVEGNENA